MKISKLLLTTLFTATIGLSHSQSTPKKSTLNPKKKSELKNKLENHKKKKIIKKRIYKTCPTCGKG